MAATSSQTPALQASRNVWSYQKIIAEICAMNWRGIDGDELANVAWAYYYFSIQFREGLETARDIYPDDELFAELAQGECATDNLSPWPGVASPGEKMNHDEFMRRALKLDPISSFRELELVNLGKTYLAQSRAADQVTRAMSIASYEDGGLEAVFKSFLDAPFWPSPMLLAFKHFLIKHIEFDSDPDHGHGALCRHVSPDDRVLPLWVAFRDLLVQAAPSLRSSTNARRLS